MFEFTQKYRLVGELKNLAFLNSESSNCISNSTLGNCAFTGSKHEHK